MKPAYPSAVLFLSLLAHVAGGAELGKIMPLGDSITIGYRRALYDELTGRNHTFKFVGSWNAEPDAVLTAAGQDYHEGHPGWVIEADLAGHPGIASKIGDWLGPSGSDPNIILLMIGTCDVKLDYETATAASRLDNLLGLIHGLRPNAELFVASIPLWADPNKDAVAVNYNAGIASAVETRRLAGEPIHFVNIHDLFTVSDLNFDGYHPNASGNGKIADAWADAIESVPEPSTALLLAAWAVLSLRKRRRLTG